MMLTALLLLFAGNVTAKEGVPHADQAAAPSSDYSDYIIERGDVLSISVWQNQELSRSVTVLPDGKIIFPLTGAVMAAGRSLSDFKEDMNERLRAFIPNLEFTVNVEQTRSMVFYIIGKVHRPGDFPLPGNISILQALAMGGGLNEFAKADQIKLFRINNGGTEVIDFNYEEVSKGKNLKKNILLQRGDILVIP